MSKRSKKSRLTKTDVNAICELQRKIDAYESYIVALFHVLSSSDKKPLVLLKGTELDSFVSKAFRSAAKLRSDADLGKSVVDSFEKHNQFLLDNKLTGEREYQLWNERIAEFKKNLGME